MVEFYDLCAIFRKTIPIICDKVEQKLNPDFGRIGIISVIDVRRTSAGYSFQMSEQEGVAFERMSLSAFDDWLPSDGHGDESSRLGSENLTITFVDLAMLSILDSVPMTGYVLRKTLLSSIRVEDQLRFTLSATESARKVRDNKILQQYGSTRRPQIRDKIRAYFVRQKNL